ncbi:MAG: ubiquinol-cytochrome c reductase iron-sulfur subunit [Bryobacteraceae bacterium]|nr:ubiquinol-cytochrome c reductase iron-sulfur subunit [Bryobacteraceae bacterium]
MDRRTFQLTGIFGLWAVMGAAMTTPALIYLLFPPKARKKTDFVEAADLKELTVNAPEEVVFRRNRADGWKVTSEKASAWVVKTAANQAIAFAPSCTHLGCAYHWDERKKEFICPCHTSGFSVEGKVLSGPAPRALDRYQVKVEGTKLLIGEVVKG